MANVIKHKRGSGSDPVASDLVVGEVAIRTDVGKLFTKTDSGTVSEIAGGGSDIVLNTLSSSSGTGGGSATFNGSAYRFTLSQPPSVSAYQLLVSINGIIQKPVTGTSQPSEGFAVDGNDIILGDAPATGADYFILTFKSLGVSEPADNSVTSAKIVDGAIVNADINASAAIAGTKISPDFGSQNIVTTGSLSISSAAPEIFLTDTNADSDYSIVVNTGQFRIRDETNSANRLAVNSDGHVDIYGRLDAIGGLDVTGAITGTGDLTIDTNTFHVDTTNDRVGIGTTSPSNNLEVASADHTGILIQSNRTTSTSNIGALDFRSSSTDVARIQSLVDGTIKFRNTSSLTERMRIDSAGRVLIGTTNNTPAASNQAGIVFGDNTAGTATAGIASFCADGAAPLLLTRRVSDGNVLGIADDTTTLGLLRVNSNDFEIRSTNNMRFQTGGNNERMRIDSSGNVGIGTTSPSNLLTLTHSANASDGLIVKNTNNSQGSAVAIVSIRGGDNASGRLEIECNGQNHNLIEDSLGNLTIEDNGTERLRIQAGGGISFNGDTAAANALDDYEEGTWTPTLPSGASATLTGQYTKIGNKVFWALQINSLSGSASFQVSGLPYTVNNGWGGNISIANDNHSPEHIYVFAHNGSSDIYFRNDSNVTYNISTFSGHFFYCSGFYQH